MRRSRAGRSPAAGRLGLWKLQREPAGVDGHADHPVDAVHANYWLSGVAGHRIKHTLDLPLVVTFHTLGRVKSAGGDHEPDHRIEAEAAVIGCADSILANTEAAIQEGLGS